MQAHNVLSIFIFWNAVMKTCWLLCLPSKSESHIECSHRHIEVHTKIYLELKLIELETNLGLNFILKCYFMARSSTEFGWCFVTVIDVYALTRSVHLNMKTLSISFKFRGHQSSVLTCFLPVTFTVCVCHLQASSSSNLLWLSRTWLKWLLEHCRLSSI